MPRRKAAGQNRMGAGMSKSVKKTSHTKRQRTAPTPIAALSDEVILQILGKIQPFPEVLATGMLVCKKWRDLAVESTSKSLVVDHGTTCYGCGARTWDLPYDKRIHSSLVQYLGRRAETLEDVVLCPEYMNWVDLWRLCDAIQRCRNLRSLEVNTGNDIMLSTHHLSQLPASLERLTFAPQAVCDLGSLACLPNLKALELGKRCLPPALPEQLLDICKLTTLTQLILHANEDNSIPEEIGRLSMLKLLQIDGMIRLTARSVELFMQLRQLHTLLLRDVDDIIASLQPLAEHPALRDIKLMGICCTGLAAQSVFKVPQLRIFRNSIFHCDPPSQFQVAVPAANLRHHRLQVLCLNLYDALVDLPALLAAPRLLDIEIECHSLTLVNLTPAQAKRLIPADRDFTCTIGAAEVARKDLRLLRAARFTVKRNPHTNDEGVLAEYVPQSADEAEGG